MSNLAKLLMGVGGSRVPVDPVPVGSSFGGGFYGGMIMIDGRAYALVVSPKSKGEAASTLQWKTTQTNTAGAASRNDGWSNTQAMIQAGSDIHPAAAFCRSLKINGYDDWYLPSRDELEILYRNLKPTTQVNTTLNSSGTNPSAIPPTEIYTESDPAQTDVGVFKEGGGEDFTAAYHWSSTQSSSSRGWYQFFGNGYQLTPFKTGSNRVRAIRRVAI